MMHKPIVCCNMRLEPPPAKGVERLGGTLDGCNMRLDPPPLQDLTPGNVLLKQEADSPIGVTAKITGEAACLTGHMYGCLAGRVSLHQHHQPAALGWSMNRT